LTRRIQTNQDIIDIISQGDFIMSNIWRLPKAEKTPQIWATFNQVREKIESTLRPYAGEPDFMKSLIPAESDVRISFLCSAQVSTERSRVKLNPTTISNFLSNYFHY
jgi:hypothetical protein